MAPILWQFAALAALLLAATLAPSIAHAAVSDQDLIAMHSRLLSEAEMEAFNEQLIANNKQKAGRHLRHNRVHAYDEPLHHKEGMVTELEMELMDQATMEQKMDVCPPDAEVDCLRPEEHEVIMNLLEHRHLMERTVTPVYDPDTTSDRPAIVIGVTANTTSADATVAAYLQAHVHQMHHLEERGDRVRQWDPLYETMFGRLDTIEMVHNFVADGVSVQHTGTTPCAVQLVQRHAAVVSGFVQQGMMEVMVEHEVPAECLEGR